MSTKSSIRIITHRRLDLSDKEFEWYESMAKKYPSLNRYLSGAAHFDDNGFITQFGIGLENNMPIEILWFLIVVSANQRFRRLDKLMAKVEKKINERSKI